MTKAKKHALKNQILTDLYNSGELQKKIEGMCYRHHIPVSSGIQEDILNETFFHLAAKSPDYILEIYNRDKKKVLGLAVRIAILKGFAIDRRLPDGFPNSSLSTFILHASTLSTRNKYINPLETFSSDATGYNGVLADEQDNPEETFDVDKTGFYGVLIDEHDMQKDIEDIDVIEKIREHLSKEDNQTLTSFLQTNMKAVAAKKKDVRLLLEKMRLIIKENNYDTRRNLHQHSTTTTNTPAIPCSRNSGNDSR